jgi:hypothetical protein
MSQRKVSPTHEVLSNIAKSPDTDPKTRAKAVAALGALELVHAKTALVRERRAAAREKVAKQESKYYGI